MPTGKRPVKAVIPVPDAPAPTPLAPLRSFGPDGEVYAQSTDGGRSWIRTTAGQIAAKAAGTPPPRGFTRRIAAVANQLDPWIERRVVTPFSVLHEEDILAGWAPFQTLAALEPNSLDAIVIPGLGADQEHYDALRAIAPVLILDIDAPMRLDEEGLQSLDLALSQVDAVFVPTDLLAQKMRTKHATVFTVPPLLRTSLWRGRNRQVAPVRPVVKIGVPTIPGTTIENVLWALKEQFVDRIEIVRYDYAAVRPQDEPALYFDLDIVIVPAPPIFSQVSSAPLLPAFAASCCVVAERHYPLIVHRHNGLQIARDTVQSWRDLLIQAINDRRSRHMMGRNARAAVRTHTPEVRRNQLALPFKRLIPAGPPVYYADQV